MKYFSSIIPDQVPIVDVITITSFGIVLPTADVYSDITFIWKIYQNGHLEYASVAIVPLILSFLFTLRQWWKVEADFMNRIQTLPCTILQVWPQYRVLRVLYKGIVKKDAQWRNEHERIKLEVSSIGNCETFFSIFTYVRGGHQNWILD